MASDIFRLKDELLSRWIAEQLDPERVPGRGVWYVAMYQAVAHHDFVNDSTKTIMLLKKLHESHKVVRLTIGTMVWVCVGSEASPDAESRTLEHIGRAVAEAFALANGWKS